jgi:pyruvate-ferredoxin/flavodoxin oxidoreductase
VVKAFIEAEAYDGPSLLLCYSHCIAHGINMTKGYDEQKNAVASGHWPLYRYNPDLILQDKNPLTIDSKDPTMSLAEYALKENRYSVLNRLQPEVSKKLLADAQKNIDAKLQLLKKLAGVE